MAEEESDAPHVATTWDALVAYFAPRRYSLVRWAILRLLGIVYVFAFLGLILQGPGLLGSHGLTPAAQFVGELRAAGQTFWDVPSIFMWDASDTSLQLWAWIGLALGLACALGWANLPSLLALWLIYGSYERIGQTWFAFGWEIQLVETTLLAAFLAHPWDPRPLAPRPPPVASIVLMRWLVFRIMLGAGLIKIRGDACWKQLTCLDWHFETQPQPNILSPFFHHLPHALNATGVVFNHVVELVLPWFVLAFGGGFAMTFLRRLAAPRTLRLVAGIGMLAFQLVLVASGNLAFLNWLTIIPIFACFDDDALMVVVPKRWRAKLDARIGKVEPRDWRQWLAAFVAFAWIYLAWRHFTDGVGMALLLTFLLAAPVGAVWLVRRGGKRIDGHQLAVGALCALVAFRSAPVIENLSAPNGRQIMNGSFDRLALVNTYGAFGSVDSVRHELVIEGTMADDPNAPDSEWRAYELPCKPGPLTRRPCVLGPYHLRLDWLIWFSAMENCQWQIYPLEREGEPWALIGQCTDDEGHQHVFRASDPWWLHLVWKLLDGDRTVRTLLAPDPFDGKPPKWVRIRRFVYHLEPYSSPTWWTRDTEQLWLPPVSRDTPGFREVLATYGWPSPSTKD